MIKKSLLVLLLITVTMRASAGAGLANDVAVSAAYEKIVSAPMWSLMSRTEVGKDGALLLSALAGLDELGRDDVRAVVLRIQSLAADREKVKRGSGLDVLSYVYILNRYYFVVEDASSASLLVRNPEVGGGG